MPDQFAPLQPTYYGTSTMPNEQTIQYIRELFESACVSLFQSLDCQVSRVDDADEALASAPIAIIDAGSDDLEVQLALQFPLSVLSLTYPMQEEVLELDETELEDWISELSNQLIGRLKQKLMACNCMLKIGLPTAYFDAELSEVIPSHYANETLYFSVDHQTCGCTVSILIFNSELTLTAPQDELADSSDNGELELF